MIIRKISKSDISAIFDLYKIVAQTRVGSLTQEESEIVYGDIKAAIINGIERGIVLVIEESEKIVGYMKAFTSKYRCLAHVLTNATIMIHPEYQHKGYGGILFDKYLRCLEESYRHILRFELFPHESNKNAINFYQVHNFMIERRSEKRIRNIHGDFEAEITLVWFNPYFSLIKLQEYYDYLASKYQHSNDTLTNLSFLIAL